MSKKLVSILSVLAMVMQPVAAPLVRFSRPVCVAIDRAFALPPSMCLWLARHTRSPTAFHTSQAGAINLQGMMMMGVMMIFLAVGFIIYPIVITACTTIDGWEYTSGTTANVTVTAQAGYTTLTGLDQVNGIMPLIVLLGFVSAGAISGFMGVKMVKSGEGKADAGSIMLLGVGVIFIAVALIIFPVVLEGVGSAYDAAAAVSFTGLTSILLVSPLIVLTAFMTGGVVAGFFGIKGIMKS